MAKFMEVVDFPRWRLTSYPCEAVEGVFAGMKGLKKGERVYRGIEVHIDWQALGENLLSTKSKTFHTPPTHFPQL